MKYLLPLLCVLAFAAGCARMREVDFVYFNLSTNEIRVTNIAGLPRDMTPGVLVPVADDTNRLHESSATCWESVEVGDAIKITWTESGSSRQFEAKRAELSIPARLDGGQVRFTYQGQGQWRIRFVDHNI